MESMHVLDLRAPVPGNLQPVADRDPLDHEHAVLVLDLADRLDVVVLVLDLDLTRLQRARERAGQSAAGRGHHVVERRRARREVLGLHPVVVGHLGVHAENDGFLLRRQVGESLRAAQPLDPHA
jgi:hypothetical protein